jgi:signal transduction histidine kinase
VWQPNGTFRAVAHAVEADPEDHARDYLVTRVPVRDPAGRLLGAIEVAESLQSRNGYLRSSAVGTLVATLGMVLVSGVVALVLGVWLVGRPLRMLTLKAQRVGAGDWGEPLALPQRDEIGLLATEVNSMCERLVKANARSEAAAQARYRALEQLRHADRLITVGRLAAGIAHELGTPLNVIAGRAKMLRRGDVEAGIAQEYLAAISEQADRTTRIIRQLMDFARRRGPKLTRADLRSVVHAIAKLVEPLARRKQIEIRCASTDAVQAQGDATQIEQVVSNLVVNAIQACREHGTVEISWGVAEKSLAGSAFGTGRCAFITVSDDGHGMSHETMQHVFEPFFTTKDVGQGTGLGLSVAHGIVQDHGGEIEVESALGAGSWFTVYLPLVPA